MHDRPALRLIASEGTIRGTTRETGISRNAIRRALDPDARDRYYRASVAEASEAAIADVLADYPAMTVSDIAVLIDWQHSRRHLSDIVARLRPAVIADRVHVGLLALADIKVGTMAAHDIECKTLDPPEVIA
ncbi:hypothetical protein [Arthrobacter sp. NPDC090010]|uniref:hypothetical protein n=1 Tax=Arthrobacter sp. NPDC090010 TaxID=3363942 RepID=UPI00382CDF50